RLKFAGAGPNQGLEVAGHAYSWVWCRWDRGTRAREDRSCDPGRAGDEAGGPGSCSRLQRRPRDHRRGRAPERGGVGAGRRGARPGPERQLRGRQGQARRAPRRRRAGARGPQMNLAELLTALEELLRAEQAAVAAFDVAALERITATKIEATARLR